MHLQSKVQPIFHIIKLSNYREAKCLNFPDYRDFYQKSLIPIGKKDHSLLMEILHVPFEFQSTHWLIALEAERIICPKEYYYWKVSIYPSDSAGSFDWNHAFYSSQPMNSLEQALILARTFEAFILKDELHTVNLQEKIS